MKASRLTARGFTLIEIMLVVAIMGIILAMGYPAISNMVHRAPMTQSVLDVMEGCRKARAMAILQGNPMELRIYPQDGRLEVVPASTDSDPTATATVAPKGPVLVTDPAPGGQKGDSFSAQISDQIRIEMVDVNFIEYKDEDVAQVRFYPNGTCDEFTMVLNSGNEWRKITLEVVTGLAGVSDMSK